MAKHVERRRRVNWLVWQNDDGTFSNQDAHLMVLMDIRDELVRLNRLLDCPNFTAIPRTLRAIRANTNKPKKRKKT